MSDLEKQLEEVVKRRRGLLYRALEMATYRRDPHAIRNLIVAADGLRNTQIVLEHKLAKQDRIEYEAMVEPDPSVEKGTEDLFK